MKNEVRYFYHPEEKRYVQIPYRNLQVAPWLSHGLTEVDKDVYVKGGETRTSSSKKPRIKKEKKDDQEAETGQE